MIIQYHRLIATGRFAELSPFDDELKGATRANYRVGLKIEIHEIHQNLRNPVSTVSATCLNQ